MKLSKLESAILLVLLNTTANEGIEPFTAFRRLKVGFLAFNQAILKLTKNGLISTENKKLSLTVTGRKFLFENKSSLIDKNKNWRSVPETFVTRQLEPNDFYIPSRSKLDTRHF